MNESDALKLCRLAKALSPSQAVDDYTPDAWHLVLRSVRYCDAALALEQLGGEREYIHVSHVKARVQRIRNQRVLDYGTLPDPPLEMDADDTAAVMRWQADTVRRIADGEHVERPALTGKRLDPDALRELMPRIPTDSTPARGDDVHRHAAAARAAVRASRPTTQEAS